MAAAHDGAVSRSTGPSPTPSAASSVSQRKAPQLSTESAKAVAIKHVAKMLMGPEGPKSLDKVEHLKRMTKAKMTAVHTRLKTTMQSQLDDVKQGMSLMTQAQVNADGLKNNLDKVEPFYESCAALKGHTDKVRALAADRDQLRALHGQIQSIFKLQEDVDDIRAAVDDGTGNMLVVHHKISELETCRDALLSALPPKGAARKTVVDYFKDVKVLAESFSMRLLTELSDPLGFQREKMEAVSPGEADGLPPMTATRLVSWLRIVEQEERNDMANPNGLGRPKGLRNKFYEKLEQVIELRFDDKVGTLKSVDNFLGRFKQFYYEDLETVKHELVPRFPPYYGILDRFLEQYHRHLFTFVEEMKTGDHIDPAEIMTLLQWVPSYKKDMAERLGVHVEQRFPQQLLGSGEGEATMRKQYVEMLQTKLKGWCENLVLMETKPWFDMVAGAEDPECNRRGLYFSHGPKNLFQMLDSQIDVAFTGGHGINFVIELLDACAATLLQYVEGLKVGVQKIYETYFTESGARTATPCPQLLPDYMMVLINSCHSISDEYLRDLINKVRELEPAELQNYQFFSRPAMSARSELVNIVQHGVNLLGNLVADDMGEHFEKLLSPKWVRSHSAQQTILLTLDDYGGQIGACVEGAFVNMILEELWKRILIAYARGWCAKRFTCKDKKDREEVLERLQLEGMDLREKVQGLMVEKRGDQPELAKMITRVRPRIRLDNLIGQICHIAKSNSALLAAEWRKLKADFPDATLHHLEAILLMREDMSAKEIKKIIVDQIVKKDDDTLVRRTSKGVIEGGDFFSHIKVSTSSELYPKPKGEEKEGKKGSKK